MQRRESAPPAESRPTQAASPAPRRSGQSLFAKVTGGAARALQAATQGSDAASRPAEPTQNSPRPMAARSASPAQPERQSAAPSAPQAASRPAPSAGNSAQPRLSGLDPAERIGHSQAEEDLLDIPAFLRRQAN
jgi:cell division protein FtsZ